MSSRSALPIFCKIVCIVLTAMSVSYFFCRLLHTWLFPSALVSCSTHIHYNINVHSLSKSSLHISMFLQPRPHMICLTLMLMMLRYLRILTCIFDPRTSLGDLMASLRRSMNIRYLPLVPLFDNKRIYSPFLLFYL